MPDILLPAVGHLVKRPQRASRVTAVPCASVWILSERVDVFSELAEALRSQLFDVRLVRHGWTTYYEALACAPSAFVVDGALRNMEARAFCCLVSGAGRLHRVPIIYIDVDVESDARARALASGASDCIVFPFIPEELLARLRVQLRRPHLTAKQAESEGDGHAPRGARAVVTLINGKRLSGLSTKDLARSVGASDRRLSRDFKEKLGVSVSAYLRREKLDRAAWLLHNTGISVTEVAHEAGFSSPCNFSVAFKKHTGLTPSEYRLSMPVGPAEEACPGCA